jgi:lysophospholipase
MLKRLSLVAFLALALTACGGSEESSLQQSSSTDPAASPLFLDEANFNADFDRYVLPLVQSAQTGFFRGVDDAQLYYSVYRNPKAKAKIVIVPGFTESSLKYRELVYNFYQAGYSVYLYDHRSQGKSTRFTEDREMVWVNSWDDYVDDFKTFVHSIVPKDEQPLLIFSHSMGAAIVADALTSEPDIARAAVISSPILALNTGKYPLPIAKAVAAAAVLIGKGKQYSPGEGPLVPGEWTVQTASTSSALRHERYKADLLAADEQMGGSSFNWVKEVLKMNDKLAKEEFVSRVTTPILMSQAGQDKLALPIGQARYCSMAKNCFLRIKPNSRHEIYNEVTEIRNPWIEEILEFYSGQLGN